MPWRNRQFGKYRTLISTTSGFQYTRDTNLQGITIVAVGKGDAVLWAYNVETNHIQQVFKELKDRLQSRGLWQ